MRSNLVYSAGLQIGNRFLLATVVMRAVRRLHVSATRTEDTANQVFAEIAEGKYVPPPLPDPEPPALIDALMVAPAA
ncbi:MAG TPA: hypothetical protein VHU89_09075 [Acidobacteriaceae bacterium]|jgi:hypothetical protein|nr:hypothetical protein [Acidobacteriaceae bacterium]